MVRTIQTVGVAEIYELETTGTSPAPSGVVDPAEQSGMDRLLTLETSVSALSTEVDEHIAAAGSSDELDITVSDLDTTDGLNVINVDVTKTDGATDSSDHFRGIWADIDINDADQEHGFITGGDFGGILTDGTVGNNRNVRGIRARCIVNGGTVNNDIQGTYSYMNLGAAGTVLGDAFGLHVYGDIDGTLGGNSVMLYLQEGSNIDYGIYQDGSAPNVIGGTLTMGSAIEMAGNGINDLGSINAVGGANLGISVEPTYGIDLKVNGGDLALNLAADKTLNIYGDNVELMGSSVNMHGLRQINSPGDFVIRADTTFGVTINTNGDNTALTIASDQTATFTSTVDATGYKVGGADGYNGTFTDHNSQTVTVTNGIITSVA